MALSSVSNSLHLGGWQSFYGLYWDSEKNQEDMQLSKPIFKNLKMFQLGGAVFGCSISHFSSNGKYD